MCIKFEKGIKRYFIFLRDKNRRVSTEKDVRHKQAIVLYGRRKRKLENRRNAVSLKTSWDTEKKRRKQVMLCMEIMSSEEEVECDGESQLVVKKLPWPEKPGV
ncbi:uncharacterized protein LOC123551123 [Mercenaria mercenaria]|uniref:uncharacterized protein LOC123551123 n=1 Tax=Mercenaria mercenaria TaxID=6596 RepID=UPI00234F8479|nr:uncharacterized protein LOC123551123 [Mercenaria mercenaria]